MQKKTNDPTYTFALDDVGLTHIYRGEGNSHPIGCIQQKGKMWVTPDHNEFKLKMQAVSYMDTPEITILESASLKIGEADVQRIKLTIPQEYHRLSMPNSIFVGIDPGSAHAGLSIIYGAEMSAVCFEIRFPPSTDLVHKIFRNLHLFRKLQLEYVWDYQTYTEAEKEKFVVVEGADYGSVFGQADLATARTVQTIAFNTYEKNMQILAPKKIRSVTFKSGDIRAENKWRFLPPNMASSLCCAICCLSTFSPHGQALSEQDVQSKPEVSS